MMHDKFLNFRTGNTLTNCGITSGTAGLCKTNWRIAYVCWTTWSNCWGTLLITLRKQMYILKTSGKISDSTVASGFIARKLTWDFGLPDDVELEVEPFLNGRALYGTCYVTIESQPHLIILVLYLSWSVLSVMPGKMFFQFISSRTSIITTGALERLFF